MADDSLTSWQVFTPPDVSGFGRAMDGWDDGRLPAFLPQPDSTEPSMEEDDVGGQVLVS